MIDGLIKHNLQLQAEAITQFKRLLNMDYDPAANPMPLYDAINRRLDDAIRVVRSIPFFYRCTCKSPPVISTSATIISRLLQELDAGFNDAGTKLSGRMPRRVAAPSSGTLVNL